MKKKICAGVCFIVIAGLSSPAFSGRALNVEPSIASGNYSETELITAAKLSRLPIPLGDNDYAFLQSIGSTTNIVIGQFGSGERKIMLLSDKNCDETVDEVLIYLVDSKRVISSPDLIKEYSPDIFKKMKRQIIEGARGELNPNAEGVSYIKKIISTPSALVKTAKYKNGYKIYLKDADDPNLQRATFYFADNSEIIGADLAFEVFYSNIGMQAAVPPVRVCVYCKGSKDKLVCDTVRDLSSYAARNLSGVK